MSTYVQLSGGVPESIASAAKLQTLAATLDEKTKPILDAIQKLEGGPPPPWGDDEAGQQFVKQYNDHGASAALRKQLGEGGSSLNTIGQAILDTLATVESTDVDSSESITSV